MLKDTVMLISSKLLFNNILYNMHEDRHHQAEKYIVTSSKSRQLNPRLCTVEVEHLGVAVFSSNVRPLV